MEKTLLKQRHFKYFLKHFFSLISFLIYSNDSTSYFEENLESIITDLLQTFLQNKKTRSTEIQKILPLKELCIEVISQYSDKENEMLMKNLPCLAYSELGNELISKNQKIAHLIYKINSPVFLKNTTRELYDTSKILDTTPIDPYHSGAIIPYSPK